VGERQMRKRSHLSLSKASVMTLGRDALGADRLVYILAVNKPVKYTRGRSRIVYIGTTKRGVRRVAASVAHHAERLLRRPGLRSVDAHLLTYGAKRGARNLWAKLERAMLVIFKNEYGDIPLLNKVGMNFWPGKEFSYFSRHTLRKRVLEFDAATD
jgi:hypothetical protein